MVDLWTTLIPLMIASTVLPVQIAITVLLLRSSAGRIAGFAWVAGMTIVRLAQWLVFGFILVSSDVEAEDAAGPGLIVSTLLLVLAVLFLVSAARKLLKQPDEDAPPPRWMAIVRSASAGQAFGLGLAAVGLNAKLWAFTLGAIASIGGAELAPLPATVVFIVFVVGAEAVHLGAVALAYLSPARAGPLLDRLSTALERHDRVIMIALGLVFGTWFLLKALRGLGIL